LLLHEANTFTEQGRLQGAEVLADPETAHSSAALADSTEEVSTEEYVPPQPKRVRGS
jgi:hypothetical protein